MPSYLEIAAKERLKLYEKQLYENSGADAALSRNLKELNRKDFAQQIQPIVPQVSFKKGEITKFQAPVKWGQLGSRRTGKNKIEYTDITPQNNAKATTIMKTGSMTVQSPGAEWTTEGYMINNNYLPKDQTNKRTVDKGDPLYINLSPKGVVIRALSNKSKNIGSKKLKSITTPK